MYEDYSRNQSVWDKKYDWDLWINIGRSMDKKMAQVSRKISTAERDIRKNKPKQAEKVLKKAKKQNVKLTKIDREVRDPMIKAYKKEMRHAEGAYKPKGKR